MPNKRALWLKPADVEAEYSIPMSTLRDWRRDGYGPQYSALSERKVLYEREAVERFIRQAIVTTADDPVVRQVPPAPLGPSG